MYVLDVSKFSDYWIHSMQHIIKYGFPFAYCLIGIIVSSFVCLTQFGNHDTNFDWYGYLVIVFIVETWYLYHYFLLRS